MNSTPERLPDARHPWWCSASNCKLDVHPELDSSGDLALSSRGVEQHHGESVDIGRQKFDEVLIAACLSADGMEPLDTTPVGVDLTLTRTVFESIESYTLSGRQVRALVVMLGSLLPALLECGPIRRREDVPDGCPSWCSEPHGIAMHARATGEVELLGRALEVQVTQPAGETGASVTLYDHDDDVTSVTSLSPGEAVELALALLGAAGLAGAR